MADAATDATTLPVRLQGAACLLAVSLTRAGPLLAQRPVLPHGLKAGRHEVGVRPLPGREGSGGVWYAAACAGRPNAPVVPCPGAPADSGLFPLLVYMAGDSSPAHEDLVLAEYLASHGYVVAVIPLLRASPAALGLDRLLRTLHELGAVDSSRIAVGGRGAGVAIARDFGARSALVRALVELDPPDDGAAVGLTRPTVPTLVVQPAARGRSRAPARQLVTVEVPSSADHWRIVPAVTHLFLSAVLRGWGDSLPRLMARLRAAGLAARPGVVPR